MRRLREHSLMVLPIDVLFRSRASGALWRPHVMLCGERDALRPRSLAVFPSYFRGPGL